MKLVLRLKKEDAIHLRKVARSWGFKTVGAYVSSVLQLHKARIKKRE